MPVDERTDIWSLGVVLYEMVAQRLPFKGATRMDTIVAILEREPAPVFKDGHADQSAMLETVVRKCLRKKSEERFHSANELLAN